MLSLLLFALHSVAVVTAHNDHSQEPLSGPHQSLWYNTLPGDGGTQVLLLGIANLIIWY
jgi:agmatinase